MGCGTSPSYAGLKPWRSKAAHAQCFERMTMKRIAALPVLACALLMSAQAPTPPPAAPAKPKPVPTITDAHRAEFFKRQLTMSQAAQAYQNAQAGLQAAVAEMSKDCGDKFGPQINPQSGDPVCVAIPARPAPPEKK
jgi:hypothetical protein